MRYRLRIMPPQIKTACTECASPVTITTKGQRDSYRRSGRAYCSDVCRDSWVARDRSQRMARTNRVHASARMKARNPMASDESRSKMAATLRGMGHRPRVRGGNGSGPTEPQRALSDLLGWPVEVVVPTGQRVKGGPPSHYKIDVGNPAAKVAVEIDGASHASLARRESDQRKDAWLRGAGWCVLRFTNEEVMADTAAVAATVLSTTSKWLARTPTS